MAPTMADGEALERARAGSPVVEPVHRPRLARTCTLAVLAVLVFGFLALPREGAPLPSIARYALEIALPQWHITEPVNEIVYGTRGFDTFGETFLLLAAVVSVSTLARHRERRAEFVGEEEAGEQEQRESDPDRSAGSAPSGTGDGSGNRAGGGDGDGGVPESREEDEARRAEEEEAGEDTAGEDGSSGMRGSIRERYSSDTNPLGSRAPEHSEAMTVVVRVAARGAAIVLAVTAIYLTAHGFAPGGGFPGGAALAGVALLLYAALGYRAVRTVVRPDVLEPVEMVGACVVVGLAVGGFFRNGSVMANWLPLAPVRTIASGGLVQAFSATELLEVGTGLTIAIFAMLAMKHDWTPDKPEDEEQSPGGSSGDGAGGDATSGAERPR
jgi:multicomponent Na+:H+ antiporter subunit B